MRATDRAIRLAPLLLAGATLAACATPQADSAPAIAYDLEGPPSTMADMTTATVRSVEAYRPQAVLPSCGGRDLPAATTPAKLEPALEAAQEYSIAKKGLGLIVMRDGAVIHASFAEGVDARTEFASASMAKSVLGLMTGIAIEKGIIGGVDDTVDRYLPEWSGDPRGLIRVRDLLTMTSGLASPEFGKFLFASDQGAAALDLALVAKPGETFYYNNAVSQVLGTLIDRQSRKAGYAGYADFLYRELWCPLGNGEALLWVDNKGAPRTYAGLHAGLADWARVGELVRNRGAAGGRQIVPAQWIDQMETPSARNPQYGYQMWLGGAWTERRRYNPDNPVTVPHAEPFIARDIVYFDGFGGQRVYVVPSARLTIARFGETNLDFDDSVLPNTILRALE